MSKRAVWLWCVIPLAVLIVLVTQLARRLGSPYEVVIPPLFAIGAAVILGKMIKRRNSRSD